VDQKIADTLKGVINTGADRYNKLQDYWGCYRLYEGALLVARGLLPHRPGLQRDIDAAIAEAEKTPQVHEKAFVLRRVIDKVRSDCDPSVKPPKDPKDPKDPHEGKLPDPKTLWDRLGGEDNVKKVVDDFVATSAKDDKVDFFRKNTSNPHQLDVDGVKKLKQQLVAYISSATGGPIKYSGGDMKKVHTGMKITDAEFDAAAAHLKAALEKNGAKADDVKAVMDAVGKTRGDIVEKKSGTGMGPGPGTEKKALWDRLGGEPVVKKVVEDFLPMLAADKKVDLDRGGKNKLSDKDMAQVKTNLIAFISQVSGGPLKYEGKSPNQAFKDLDVTEEQYKAAEADFKAALKNNKVADADANDLVTELAKFKGQIVQKK